MLLITCPWCGPRDEVEFHYGGQAGVAHPADPDALDDAFAVTRCHRVRGRHVAPNAGYACDLML